MSVIAIDLGGSKLAAAIFTSRGRILHRNVVTLKGRRGKAVGRLIREMILDCLRIAAEQRQSISGIGIAIPGIVDHLGKTVWAPNIPGWKKYPLQKEIESILRNHRIPVRLECDRACYILGEVWQGAARGCKDAIFLAVGTGIGAGILADGKILNGAHGVAGAIGWMGLRQPYLPQYKRCGCFEYHASGRGLATEDLFAAWQCGDPLAKEMLRQAVADWGMATANLVSLFNPEKIIFGGGVFGPAVQFLPDILAEAKKWAQPISIKQVKLEASKLGGDAGVFGAAFLALPQNVLLTSGKSR